MEIAGTIFWRHMQTLTIEQTKELRGLCHAGRLYDIEKMLAQYGTITAHPDVKRAPIDIAMKLGFHSLVELLIRKTDDIKVKNHALRAAVRNRRFDMVEMLVGYGADPLSAPFEDVLCSYDAEMGRYFMSKGADLVTGNPFAIAFQECTRPALGVYLDAYKAYPHLKDALQRQLDMALSYHCKDGSIKWVSLLMWAHADPLARVPGLDDPEEDLDDPALGCTGARYAAMEGHLEVIKRICVNHTKPGWQDALRSACSFGHTSIVEFLLDKGVKPNDKPNGGASGLDSALNAIGRGARFSKNSPYPYPCTASPSIEVIRLLVEHGALWVPDDNSAINGARRSLYEVEKRYTLDVIKLFATYGACDKNLLWKFVSSSTMVGRLALDDLEKLIDKQWLKGRRLP